MHKPSAALVAATLAGLLASCSESNDVAGAGCAVSDAKPSSSSDTGAATDADPVREISKEKMTFDDLRKLCDGRGGFMQTTAACAGAASCRGLSYLAPDGPLTEHSCKGLNYCAGFSCVIGPEDKGLTGKAIFDDSCAGCHGSETKDSYTVFVRPGTLAADAIAKVEKTSTARLARVVAFGTQGFNDDGAPFSNMPAYREKLSRAEIQRAVEYLRGLRKTSSEYEIYAPSAPEGI